jgi:dTDP-3-amino-2,3,6-trideoxy-4-keto-D-glucose/dTDP-3-amino-3,4,6-trideoxy-alpha-D-glucose/dTDP-2,6-dideoxy-D-kanosamine transaminase
MQSAVKQDLSWVPLNSTARVFASRADELRECMSAVGHSGIWLNGPATSAFAASFAAFLGAKHVIPVANGTDALEIGMRAVLHVRQPLGSEVVTIANAGGYATTAARHVQLTPVYVDIDEDTQLADISSILAAVNDSTAMIVVTHLYGNVVDVPAIREALDAGGWNKVAIIEDCAQAHGAKLRTKRAGSLADLATFSFYPTKNLGAMGDAGAIATSDADLAAAVTQLRQYGWSLKYDIGVPGGRNSRMDEMQGAVLKVLLPDLDANNARRVEIINAYRVAVPDDVRFCAATEGSVAHLAVALCQRRDDLRRHLSNRAIATDVHYPILDCDQTGWSGIDSRIGPGGLERSRRSVAQLITLPCFPHMSDGEVSRVVEALRAWGNT